MDARKALKEPLVQFAVIGLLLFGADRLRRGPAATESVRVGGADATIARHLVVDDDVRAQLRASFERTQGRAPSAAELDEGVGRWVDEEILFREALARRLDRGDDRVRGILAGKMRTVLEQEVLVPEPQEAELRAYFEKHAARWSKSEAFDFVHVYVRGDDEAAAARARGLLADLEKGAEPGALGDTFSGGRRYRKRSIAELTETFGDEFAAGLDKQPAGKWTLRKSRFGHHLVRIEGSAPAEAPPFTAVREDVKKQVIEEKKAAGVAERTKAIRTRWEVVEAKK